MKIKQIVLFNLITMIGIQHVFPETAHQQQELTRAVLKTLTRAKPSIELVDLGFCCICENPFFDDDKAIGIYHYIKCKHLAHAVCFVQLAKQSSKPQCPPCARAKSRLHQWLKKVPWRS